jgi:hypothetical protein
MFFFLALAKVFVASLFCFRFDLRKFIIVPTVNLSHIGMYDLGD